jgi:hypothetical protein
VPDDIADGQLKGKVFYVWFDAPIEYIAATKEWADKNGKGDAWKDWWYGDAAKDVTYWEFMGKDNVPFHTVGFPVTIMGSGEPWKKVDRLKGFNWLNYDGGKFSTSGKRGIFMDTALESRRRLLALLPDRQCAGRLGQQFHLGTVRRRSSTRTWPTCWAISSTGSPNSAPRASTARCRARASMARTKRP